MTTRARSTVRPKQYRLAWLLVGMGCAWLAGAGSAAAEWPFGNPFTARQASCGDASCSHAGCRACGGSRAGGVLTPSGAMRRPSRALADGEIFMPPMPPIPPAMPDQSNVPLPGDSSALGANPLEPAPIPSAVLQVPERPALSESNFATQPMMPLSSSLAASSLEAPLLPNVIGDFFGTGTTLLTVRGTELLNATPSDVFSADSLGGGPASEFLLPSPGGSVVGSQKIAENNSPIPRNRVFLNSSYFNNAALAPDGVGVQRYVPGIEQTFWDGNASVELRIPTAVTLDSDSVITGGSSRDQFELGNLQLGLKGVLYSDRDFLISTGLGVTAPTADNLRFFNANGRELIRVDNQAVHLLPYLAGAWSDGGFFAQGFLQADFDLNGNAVRFDEGSGLRHAGRYNEVTFLFLDLGVGYWLIKNPGGSRITGIAPTLELHYNTALETTDVVQSPAGFRLGNRDDRVELVNYVVGATVELQGNKTLTVGYAQPLGGGDDEQFDGEFRVLLNYYFGGPSPHREFPF